MHTRRRGERGLGLVFLAGLLALLSGLVWLAFVLATWDVQRAASWASVLGTCLGIIGALITLVTWQSHQRAAIREPTRVDQVARAEQELQAVVREQWRREAEARSLGDPDPMPVRWRLSGSAVMDHVEHIASDTRLRFAGRSDLIPALTAQFRALRRRRLVITGSPGSGKTTLAVQLLLDLVEDWQPGEAVPVLFSLASWNPHDQPRVQDWLAGQLSQTYPDLLRDFGSDVAQKLADQGRLLPVLDGLDEIPPERRGEVIARLNASLHSDTGLILTSRTVEYAETIHISDVLTAAAVIQAEPLTASEAARYLEDRLPRLPGDSWQAVLTALRCGTAGALAEVVTSPLGLWLLRIVHIDGHRDPRYLIDPELYPDPVTLQHHLLEELIPAAIHSRPPLTSGQDSLRPRHPYDPDHVRRWLTALAIELRDAKTLDWRWWQFSRHSLTDNQIELAVVLPSLLLVWPTAGLVFWRVGVLLAVLIGGLASWLAICVGIAGRMSAHDDHFVPKHTDFQLRGRTRELGFELMIGMTGGLAGGLWLAPIVVVWGGFALGWKAGLVGGLASLLIVGLVGGPTLGVVNFAASPSIAQRASSPTESHRGDRRRTVLVISILGMECASVFGLVGILAFGPWIGLPFGLLFGLWFGLMVGLVMSRTCWPTFLLASLRLGAQRRLPLLLMRFLDDAYRLGLLRVVGPVYQFRHAALQDHLAPPAKLMAVAAAGPPDRGARKPMRLSADASNDPLSGVHLGEVVRGALDLSASECRPGALLQTGALLDALARIDALGNWTRIWLHTGVPENLHLVDAQDESGGGRSQVEQIRWAGVPFSASLVEAFKILLGLAQRNSMSVILPGALALALLAKPTFGATKALLVGGTLDHAQLLDLVQTELLGKTLEGIEGLISEKIPPGQSPTEKRHNRRPD